MVESTRHDAGSNDFEATLLLRPRQGELLAADLTAMAGQRPARRTYLTHDEYNRRYGASRADVERVREFAAANQLEVISAHLPGRLVELAGPAENFCRAFAFQFAPVLHGEQQLQRPEESVRVPDALQGIVEGIFGLDELPKFHRRSRASLAMAKEDSEAQRGTGDQAAESEIAVVSKTYQFPPKARGAGQSIAIILLGGGFYEEDMRLFFGDRLPKIRVVELAGATNNPAPRAAVNQFLDALAKQESSGLSPAMSNKVWWTLEATVDLQLAGSFAPDAQLVVYFAPNDERGKIDALTAALTDEENAPSVISCSWGMRESDAKKNYLDAVEKIFQLAATKGISICYSSGDSGADQREKEGPPHVHYPASSPHVLACGGTQLSIATPERPQAAWNESHGSTILATGGGYSQHFPQPTWQSLPPDAPTGRGVPDVAGKADYASYYHCTLVGRTIRGGGTSAAVPMWAALLARLNQALGHRVGWLTPLLYQEDFAKTLEDIDRGGNGYYQTTQGWDPCTGRGTPLGQALLKALSAP